MVGIYKIQSPSGRVYIGQSRDIINRKRHYAGVLCKSQWVIYNSLKKYGWRQHTFSIIHELPKDITDEILTEYEQLYIDAYKECGCSLMNLRDAGNNGKMLPHSLTKTRDRTGHTKGYKKSPETLARLSASLKGKRKSDTHRNNIKKSKLNTSKETKQKMLTSRMKFYSENRNPRKTDENKIDLIISDFLDKRLTLNQIAQKHSVGKTTIQRIAKERGVNNTRSSVLFTYKSETMSLSKWAKKTGRALPTISYNYRNGKLCEFLEKIFK